MVCVRLYKSNKQKFGCKYAATIFGSAFFSVSYFLEMKFRIKKKFFKF